MAVKETFSVFLFQIEVLDWKRCRKDRKNLSQTTKGYNKRNSTWERNITRFEFSHVARYNLGQNLLIHITKILIFCNRPPKKSSQIESPFHAYPILMLFAVTPEMHTWAFRPKQLWTKIGGGGGDFVPVRNDCSMARNYETHGNVKWALSGVVECVVRHSKISGRSRGGAPGAWSSLFVDQTEAQRAEKLFYETAPPPP